MTPRINNLRHFLIYENREKDDRLTRFNLEIIIIILRSKDT